MMRRVFYHCFTITGHPILNPFLSLFSVSLSSTAARPKPSTLGWRGKCSTTGLPLLVFTFETHFYTVSFLSVSASSRTQTLSLGMMKWVLYHCDTLADHPICIHFYPFFSPGVSVSTWTGTLNLEMMRWVFYHCAAAAGGHVRNYFLFISQWSLSPLRVKILATDFFHAALWHMRQC